MRGAHTEKREKGEGGNAESAGRKRRGALGGNAEERWVETLVCAVNARER